jgi:outer membrane protein insertion porin family
MKKLLVALVALLALTTLKSYAQPAKLGGDINYQSAKMYIIAGIAVTGTQHSDIQAIKLLSGLQVGDEVEIPGDAISNAIKALWNQRLFADVEIYASEIRGEEIFLEIRLQEMPRMSNFKFTGIKRSSQDNLAEQIKLRPGLIVTEDMKNRTCNIVENYFIDKGFLFAECQIREVTDTLLANSSRLFIDVKKGEKVKIAAINFDGASEMSVRKLHRSLKNTKPKRWWSVFKASKYIDKDFREDLSALLLKYNESGYRNARVLGDSLRKLDNKRVNLDIYLEEGSKFYFRDIEFVGNTIYTTGKLDSILNISSGDIYDISLLESRLYMNMAGQDITSLYQDNGYLNFQAYPIETLVENDSIDIEVRISEGKKYRIGKVTVTGNTKTNDHVVYREIRTKPGDLFSRNDIIRTQRELAQLGYFDPQKFQINPTQNPAKGTVDIEYVVEEKPSDQVELSGGWGGGRVVGSLGLSFSNFSIKNTFKKGAWRPVPSGDGQRFSIRAQSNGAFFQSYNISFIEPWLGGKKANSLSFSAWHSVQSNGERARIGGETNPLRRDLKITGASVGLGKRLQKPDDWFTVYAGLSYQHFNLNDLGSFFSFDDGVSNNLALNLSVGRNSVSDPIYPTWGSDIKLTMKMTPPYSAIGKLAGNDRDFSMASDQEKFRWVEYYKAKFTAKWYTSLWSHKVGEEGNTHSLVLATSAGVGFLGAYNQNIGLAPFERFYLGGVFLSGYILDGREIVNLRGYDDLSLTYPSQNVGSPLITKYTAELRYPLSTNPNASIYTLAFLEAGKTWENFDDWNPFNVMRSGGVGLRIFLPMFGMLGLDYGWRFDDVPQFPNMARGTFHFSIGANLGEL